MLNALLKHDFDTCARPHVVSELGIPDKSPVPISSCGVVTKAGHQKPVIATTYRCEDSSTTSMTVKAIQQPSCQPCGAIPEFLGPHRRKNSRKLSKPQMNAQNSSCYWQRRAAFVPWRSPKSTRTTSWSTFSDTPFESSVRVQKNGSYLWRTHGWLTRSSKPAQPPAATCFQEPSTGISHRVGSQHSLPVHSPIHGLSAAYDTAAPPSPIARAARTLWPCKRSSATQTCPPHDAT